MIQLPDNQRILLAQIVEGRMKLWAVMLRTGCFLSVDFFAASVLKGIQLQVGILVLRG